MRSQFTFYNSKIVKLITQRNLDPSEFPNILGVNCGFDPVAFTFLACTRNINAASALARGFEAEVTWEIGSGFSSEWTYTYADSHYTANPVDPTAVGQRLEGVPMHNASASLTYDDPSGWQATTMLRYISKSYGDAHPEDGLIQNAHFVVDASASYPLTQHLQAYAQIQNLFNTRYIASNGGGAPILGTPFQVMGGLRVKSSNRPVRRFFSHHPPAIGIMDAAMRPSLRGDLRRAIPDLAAALTLSGIVFAGPGRARASRYGPGLAGNAVHDVERRRLALYRGSVLRLGGIAGRG